MKKIYHFYNELAFRLLSKNQIASDVILTKTRALLLLWTSTTVVMWFYVLYCFMAYGNKSPVAWGGLIFTILHSLVPIVFKYTQSFPIAGLTISLTGLGFQTLFCVFSGGVFSPAAIWLTFHPVILGFFGNTSLIIFSVALNFIIVMSLFFLGHLGILPPNSLPDAYRNSMIITSYVGLDILVAVFTITAIKINTDKNNELSKSKELTENLLRILCHDINNPLSIIKIASKHINSEDMDATVRYTTKIKRASEDIQKITKSVGSWMALKDGKISLNKDVILIKDAIDHIQFSFEDRLKEKQIKIQFEMTDPNLEFIGDRTAIFYQIFNNLISNAIKFSYESSIINISFTPLDEFIRVTIRDYGVGIKIEMIDKLFSAYDKTSSKGTKNERGTGFGLPIVAAVTERLNGKIVIDNMGHKYPNQKGTEVSIYLPRM